MRRIVEIRLWAILLTALIGIALHSTATAQTVSASGSPTTAPAASGEKPAADDVCEQRLLKALDALEKAEQSLTLSVNENTARAKLDALKDQYIAVKDLIIAEQDKYIDRLLKKKNGLWAKVKKALEVAEKIALVALGVYLGGR